jgi:hypothetical protein
MSEIQYRVVYDCVSQTETIIPLTPEEIEEGKRTLAEAEARQAAFEAEAAAKQAARESAIAKLSALGLTEEEAAAIVGI